MVKRETTETIKEYDEHGRLIRETTTKTTEEDTSSYGYQTTSYPLNPNPSWDILDHSQISTNTGTTSEEHYRITL